MIEAIEAGIGEVVKELGLESVSFSVEHPEELSFGDYATNVALVLGKKTGKNTILRNSPESFK